MMPPSDGLDELARHTITRLARACSDREAPWRTPMLATVTAGGAPAVRTVVLRAVDPTRRLLEIHTDRRSGKALQVAAAPAVELGFWDPGAREQLRIGGTAVLLTDGPRVDDAWRTAPDEVRAIYLGACPPGTPLPRPGRMTPDPADGGRPAFAILEVAWTRFDWLRLGAEGHRRAQFTWQPDGGVRSAWIEP